MLYRLECALDSEIRLPEITCRARAANKDCGLLAKCAYGLLPLKPPAPPLPSLARETGSACGLRYLFE